MRRERERGHEVGRERDGENRFPFSGARSPPAQRSLISSSPNSTAAASFFFPSLPCPPFIHSPSATPPRRNVRHVLFRSGDQHCYGSVLRPVLRYPPRHAPLALSPYFSNPSWERERERENDSVLLIILVLAPRFGSS